MGASTTVYVGPYVELTTDLSIDVGIASEDRFVDMTDHLSSRRAGFRILLPNLRKPDSRSFHIDPEQHCDHPISIDDGDTIKEEVRWCVDQFKLVAETISNEYSQKYPDRPLLDGFVRWGIVVYAL